MRDTTDMLTGELMLLVPGEKPTSGRSKSRRPKVPPGERDAKHEQKLAANRAKRYRSKRKAAALAVLDNLERSPDVLLLDQLRLAVSEKRGHIIRVLAQELIDRYSVNETAEVGGGDPAD